MPDAPDLTSSDMATAKDKIRDAWRVLHPDAALPDVLNASERGITAMTLAEGSYSGLLVALWLDPEQAAQLAVAGGQPAESLHVTLCYRPSFDHTDESAFEVAISHVISAVANVAALNNEFTGKVAGFGRFLASDASDGNDVFWALPEISGLDWLREAVNRSLDDIGLLSETNRTYVPHITLQYLPSKAKFPNTPQPVDLTFKSITVAAGTRVVTIPFRSGTEYVGTFGSVFDEESGKPRMQLTQPLTFSASDEWVHFLPKPGTYTRGSGTLTLSTEQYGQFLQNFNDRVYGQDPPINAEHDLRTSGAVGWIKEMRFDADGGLEIRPEWNDRGRSLIEGDKFRYVSAEFFPAWQQPETAEWFTNVVNGMAICTRPHFKESALRPLAASEIEALHTAGEDLQEKIGMTDAEKKTPPAAITLTEAQYKEFEAFQELGGVAKLTALSERNESLSKSVDEMKSERRLNRFTEIARGRAGGSDGIAWQGDLSEHVAMLTTLAEDHGDDSEHVNRYIKLQTAQATQFAEALKPFLKPVGTYRSTESGKSAYDEIEDRATKLSEADPKLTHAQAIDKAFSAAPAALKQQYRDERPSNRSDAD